MEKVVIIGSGCAGWTAALYTGARQSPAAGAHRPAARRLAHHHQHRRKLSRLSRRRGRLRIDDADAETGGTLRRAGQFRHASRRLDFSKTPFVLTVDGEKVEAANRHHRHRREPPASRRARRGFAGDQGRDLLRDLRRRVAGFPQPAARRGRRRRFRLRRGALSDALRLGDSSGPSPRQLARVQNHGRTRAVESENQAGLGFGRDRRCST